MKKGILWVDIEKCLACKTCELQCAVSHSQTRTLPEAVTEIPVSLPRLQVEAVKELSIPLQCRHCEDAPCVKVCPTGALDKSEPEMPVLLDKEFCIGCRFCIQVCPFGVIRMDKAGTTIIKCDLCIDRLRKDELPACVNGCPTKALKFISIDEHISEKRKRSAEKFLVEYKKDR